jgi:hypothetical protein
VTEYVVAIDIAKRRDWTWWLVLRDNVSISEGSALRDTPDRILHYYDIVVLEKAQNLKYQTIVKRTQEIMGFAELQHNADLVVDGTGVGDAVVDMMREAGLSPVPIIVSGGTQVREVYFEFGQRFSSRGFASTRAVKEIHVPKQDLVAAGQKVAEQHRLGRSSDLAGTAIWEEFLQQMSRFTDFINDRTGRHKYEAFTEADHDDAVSAYLMAIWWTLHARPRDRVRETVLSPSSEREARDWNPYDHMGV